MISVVYLSTVSAICGGMGLFILWKRIDLFLKANRAIGYFVRWEQRGLRRMHYYPVVRFHAMNGNEYEFVGEPGTSSKNGELGVRLHFLSFLQILELLPAIPPGPPLLR